MKSETEPRYPVGLIRTLLVLILGLVTTIYFLHRSLLRQAESRKTNSKTIMSSMTPMVSGFTLKKKTEAPPAVIKDVTIGKSQTFSQLMQAQGFDADTIQQVFNTSKDTYNLSKIGAGKNMVITATGENDFLKLEYDIDPLQTLIVSGKDEEMQAKLLVRTPITSVHELGGYIEGSLYSTIDRLGESDDLVIRFAEIFEWDVDFFRDLQAGDTFRIIYEKQTVEGNPYAYGKILAAELINKGRTITAIGYQQDKNWEYFSPDGQPMKKAFLAAPLKFTRISSGFTSRRYHPVLKKYRAHYGIDYAAPAGTPVRAIGKGRVILAGWAGGAGKTIKIQHDQNIQTVYCHLSKFAGGVTRGASVGQGEVIGYVGSTGMSTAPHLDFRFMKNGKYVNWLTIKTPQADPLKASDLARFQEATGSTAQQLAAVSLMHASKGSIAYTPIEPIAFTE